MLDHLRLETLVGLGAVSLLGYVLWGPKATKTRAANAAGVLAGLQNIGNSCFLNAVLQALASSGAVIRWLNSPSSAGASPAHRKLRAALIDVIQVVNRSHPERRADPFTPAGVVACLLQLGWLIRRDEQDTHEMFYVLVSTLQEELPPPSLALSADGLRAGDGSVEPDTGELLVDWGALGAKMGGVASDICGAGLSTGAGTSATRAGGSVKTARGEARPHGPVNGRAATGLGAGAGSRLPKDGPLGVCGIGTVSAPLENGDVVSAAACDDGPVTSQTVDGRVHRIGDSFVADDLTLTRQTPPKASRTASPNSEPPSAVSSQPAAIAATSNAAATSGVPGAAADGPSADTGRPASRAALTAGVVGRRPLRGIVHRVRGASSPSWRGSAGPLRSPFTGTVSTQLVCQACGHKCAVRWENFESLSLPLPAAPRPQALSLPALLGQFSARETVHDVTCDACHRRGRFSKRTLVAKLPSALCLHLPRTMWQDNGQAGKRGDHVSFFETLNMFPYTYAANVTTGTPGRLVSPPVDSGRHTYRLTAVIVHTGGASSGHFVTYRRQPDPADGRWFYTSDTLVSRASASEVFSAAAYMLFYDRVTPATTAARAGAAAASPVAAALLSPVAPAMLSPGPSSPLLSPAAEDRR